MSRSRGGRSKKNSALNVPVHGRTDAPERSQNEGGTLIQVWADGFKFQTNADSSTVEVWCDGSTLFRTPDGVQQLQKPDGYMRQTSADGHTIERWPDGRQRQSNPDGSAIAIAVDGSTTYFNADGTLRGSKAAAAAVTGSEGSAATDGDGDAIVRTTLGDGTIIEAHANGRKMLTFPSGVVKTEEIDGSWSQMMPNGSIITSTLLRGEDPDTGLRTMLQTNVDGSSIETDEDGIVTQVTPDGTRITVHEDGSMVQTSADGERLFKRKDGTIERSCVTEAGGLSAGEDSESDRAVALGDVDDAATPVVAASSYSSRRRSTFLTRVDSAPCSSASAAKAKGATAKLTRENEELAFALDAKTSALREVKRKLRRLEKKEELRKRIELETKSGADEARGDRVLKSKLKAIEARFENARETINEKERRIAQLEALQAELRRTAETTRSASGSDDTIECSEAVATDTARSPRISRTSAASPFRIFAQAPEPSALQLLRAAHARSEAESLAPTEVSTIAIAIAALSAGERASSESESSSSRSSSTAATTAAA